MFKLALFLLLTYSLYAEVIFENHCVDNINQLSARQIDVLIKAYRYGEPYGLGFTLSAIAWKESCAGEYRMNFQDPSAGIFHAHIPTVLKRYPQLKNNGFTQNRIGELLVRNDDFAAKEAISQLLYWKKAFNDDWDSVIKSYNKGFSWQKDKEKNKLASSYLQDVRKRYVQLKEHLPKLIKLSKKNLEPLKLPMYDQQNLNKQQNKKTFSNPYESVRSFHNDFIEIAPKNTYSQPTFRLISHE